MKVFCKEFITVWTRGLVRWLSRKFDSISIYLTPVENKLDDVKTAVENINVSHLATEANATANKNAIIAAVNNAQPDLSSVAKQGTNPNATNTAILAATAKETTAQEIKELVLQEGIILGNEYAETINDIIGDWSNE